MYIYLSAFASNVETNYLVCDNQKVIDRYRTVNV